MKYNFDEVIDRRNTNSLKWDFSESITGVADTLPFWVADMDFQPPPEVREAIERVAKRGVFGYTLRPDSCVESIQAWLQKRLRWTVSKEWIHFTPGIVPAANMVIQQFTKPGDEIILQHPVYYPLTTAVENNGRILVSNKLINYNGRYMMNFDELEQIITPQTKMMILCNPHNPVGRVWQPDELIRLAEICEKYDLLIMSDEIHADLIMPGHHHVPIASISPEIADRTITFYAPSKTFNLAGLQMGMAIISNEKLRIQFEGIMMRNGLLMSNIFAIAATEAAYTYGEDWLEQLLSYLKANYDFMTKVFAERAPRIKPNALEGTYLAWLDCWQLGMGDDELKQTLLEKAKVWLDGGTMFGPGGERYQRINLATSRMTLELGLNQMIAALI